ncbi:MAG: sigma-70 family RNA polymerase sigma factor [Dehalococcoidia bacterium]|nr:sigma-70 family RNA polymerase sigma factor [Dehalococcoidia bacterium]
MDEETLIQQCKQGSHDAFQELTQRYQGLVYNLAYRMTGDTGVAQDIMQDSLTAAYREMGRFRPGNFRAWLLRIAVNASKDHLRSATNRRQTSLDQLAAGDTHQWQDNAESPEDFSLRQEVNRALQKAMMQLPEEQRTALVLIDIQGLEYQEAATVLKIPAGTLKSRLSRARIAMRRLLSPQAELFPHQFRLNK